MAAKDGYKIIKQTKHINQDGTYWETEEQVISRYNEKGYLYKTQSNVIRSFLDNPYPEELTWADRGKLGRLEYELNKNQALVYKSGLEIKPHTIKTISRILDSSERQTRELIKKCKRLGVIGEAKIKTPSSKGKFYFINPMYKSFGKRMSLISFMVFREYLLKEIPEWVIEKYLEDMQLSEINIDVLK